MSQYNVYPAVDADYNFPPVVRQAIASSAEVSTGIDISLTQKIPTVVERIASEYVASEPLVRDAAIAAINTEISNSDLLDGTDFRVPVVLEGDSGWTHAFTDGTGRIVAGIDMDGVFHTAQPISSPGGTDRSSRTEVACVGDSLVYGYQTADAKDTWPSRLAAAFPGVTFINGGQSGATIDEIRFRNGSMPLYAEIKGGVIPASGPVEATVKQAFGFGAGHQGAFYGGLAGVNGNLIVTPDGKTWTFERAVAGSAVAAPGKQQLIRAVNDYLDQTMLIWMGRNDVSYRTTGFEGNVVDHVVAGIKATVDHLRPNDKQFGVATILNQAGERRGSAGYELIVEINRRLKLLYPSNIIDMRDYLVNRAIYDAGLTPTAADLKAISEDAPPPQIMDAGSHPLVFMIPLIAKQFENYLNQKGYV